MQALRQFSIPIKGLDFATYNYSFVVDAVFFEQFPDSPYKNGNLKVEVELDKKSDHIILEFVTDGTLRTECDRCTAEIDFPVSTDDYEMIIKYDENERDEGEVAFIHPESHELNVAKYIYDHIILSTPLIKVFDCYSIDPRPCNENVLALLDQDTEKEPKNNPLGDALKDFKIKAK